MNKRNPKTGYAEYYMNKRNPKTGYSEYYHMSEEEKPTDSLSQAGRFGDDRIGVVDGEPAHINAWEEYLLDTHGEIGEEIVKTIGSGTINRETEMPEYWDPKKWYEENIKPIGKMNLFEGVAYIATGGLYDLEAQDKQAELLGTGKYSDEAIAERELKSGLSSAMGSAASTWSDQLETSFGPEGSIAKEFNLERKIKGSQIGNEYSKMNQSQAQAQSSSGFATMGQANQQFDFTNANLMTEKSFQDQSKQRDDLLINMEKEMNQMLVDYMAATGKEYKGKAFNDLRSDIDQYQGT